MPGYKQFTFTCRVESIDSCAISGSLVLTLILFPSHEMSIN